MSLLLLSLRLFKYFNVDGCHTLEFIINCEQYLGRWKVHLMTYSFWRHSHSKYCSSPHAALVPSDRHSQPVLKMGLRCDGVDVGVMGRRRPLEAIMGAAGKAEAACWRDAAGEGR